MKNVVTIVVRLAIAAVALWAGDSAIRSIIIDDSGFFSHLLPSPSAQILYDRILPLAGICVGLAIVVIVFNLRLRKQDAESLRTMHARLQKEISERSGLEKELARSRQFFNTVFDSFHDPFSIIDHDFRIIRLNEAYAALKGKQAAELNGQTCYKVLHGRTEPCPDCIVLKTFQSKDPCAKEKLIMQVNGMKMWVEIYTYPILEDSGNVQHVVEYSRDITIRKKIEEEKDLLIKKLNHLSTTDHLTGLLNRRALNDTLLHEINRASRYGSDLSLILCDIDMFKGINDTFGHIAGDLALQAVAEALRCTLRRSDIIGRYGGDEFMIIMPETSIEGARILAEKIRLSVNELDLLLVDGRHARLSMSIGVVNCCSSNENLDTLVSLADNALYISKQTGRNRVSAIPQTR